MVSSQQIESDDSSGAEQNNGLLCLMPFVLCIHTHLIVHLDIHNEDEAIEMELEDAENGKSSLYIHA